MNAKGLDLSRYNGRGDWKSVKAAGINFVYIKAGGIYSDTGVCYTDDLVDDHVAGARSVDIPFGLYWYFLPFRPVSNQDIYFQKLIDQFEPQLWSAIDAESNNGKAASLITSTLKEMVHGFSDFDHPAILYTRASWFNPNVLADPLWKTCDLWASRWKTGLTSPWSDGSYKFRDWSDWRFWQYSGDNNARAKEYGFPGPPPPNYNGDRYSFGDPDIDLDYFNGTVDDFRLWAGLEKPQPTWEQAMDVWARGLGYDGPTP
jgi:lysozyme